MTRITIPIERLPHGAGLDLPGYATDASAGMDIPAALEAPVTLAPGERVLVPAGFRLALPAGVEAQIRPRSGLALEHGVTVLNAPGTIDADYRGEVMVLLTNLGREDFTISREMRVAQLVIAPVWRARWAAVERLPATARGEGGFGSTGS